MVLLSTSLPLRLETCRPGGEVEGLAGRGGGGEVEGLRGRGGGGTGQPGRWWGDGGEVEGLAGRGGGGEVEGRWRDWPAGEVVRR